MWSILTEPGMRGRGWSTEEFFQSGRQAVDALLAQAAADGLPDRRGAALDFGCGIGRLTRSLAVQFDNTVGLDISASMIRQAEILHAGVPGLRFVHDCGNGRLPFRDGEFDLVVSLYVLQHIPAIPTIDGYVREFVRVLRLGGVAIVEMPDFLPPPPSRSLRDHVRASTRLAGLLRKLGMSPQRLRATLGWDPPMPMTALPQPHIGTLIEQSGGHLVTATSSIDHGGARGVTYFATR